MSFNCSDKKTVQWLLSSLKTIGVSKVVLSPGSRNAPLIISFANCSAFECFNIVDERSAAFYALGMAKQAKEPVALCCTSGSALLNYAPAISEAFYQDIPLLIITADRPPELIDQEDGQTIHQEGVFSNYIKGAINLPTCDNLSQNEGATRKQLSRTINQAIQYPLGPVHINIPFNEPIYRTVPFELEVHETFKTQEHSVFELNNELKGIWKNARKILIIVGTKSPDKELESVLYKLSQNPNTFILASAISNVNAPISCSVESVVYDNNLEKQELLAPELLITIGGPLVSKALKQFIRKVKPAYHWDIDNNPKRIDTYQCLSHQITGSDKNILGQLTHIIQDKTSNYQSHWLKKAMLVQKRRTVFADKQEWNDFSVFKHFFDSVNKSIDLHLGNSTPVRYAELFDKHPLINYYGNRGTSGIDGSTSTAAGAAIASGKTTYLITGDLSFMYDSNALWNNHLPNNFKIILINNAGGNIFKIIKGPEDSEQLNYFQANTPFSADKLCQAFSVSYYSAKNKKELEANLTHLQNSSKCSVLEILTDAEESAQSYRNYFRDLLQT